MATEEEMTAVKQQIESFFKFAGTSVPWNGVVNEDVAGVFGLMLNETAKCSKALAWVPRPPLGPATIGYLATQFGGALFRRFQRRLSVTCAKKVILNLRVDFELASRGAYSSARSLRWA